MLSKRVLEVAGAIAVIVGSMGCSSSHLVEDGAVAPGEDAGPVVLMDSGPPPPTPVDSGLPPTPGDAGPPPLLDSGTPPLADSAVPHDPDSGPPLPSDAGTPGVMCGTMMCGAGEICCATFSGGALMQTCTAADACTGATLTCDGPEDCSGGEVCCGVGGGGAGPRGTECRAAAMCSFRVCRADGDCPTGSECCPFMGSGVCSSFGCFGGP